MPMLHDTAVRAAIIARVRALRPDTRPRWGKMSADQMLWHVNKVMAVAMGDETIAPATFGVPRALLKFMILKAPSWKSAPTAPAFKAAGAHDFHAEQEQCVRLVEKLVSRPLNSAWPTHPFLGPVTGQDISQLQAKHLDHHLKQFGL